MISPSRWIVACDIGQSIDPTAVAILEVRSPSDVSDAVTMHDMDLALAKKYPPRIDVRHLERLPLRTSYVDVVAHVGALLRRAPLDRCSPQLVLDQTGVGRPVVDMFRRAGLAPVGVTITAGEGASRTPEGDYRVSKLLLVSRMLAALHEGSLRIAKELPDARTLALELQDFRANISEAGYTRFGAREGKHDDLVLAVAIGAWWASRPVPSVTFSSAQI